jgi:hypothetical protein
MLLKIAKLKDLLLDIGEPLGLGENVRDDMVEITKFIKSLRLPTYNDFT